MRLRRRRLIVRSLRKARELRPVQDNTQAIRSSDILLFSTFRNEGVRLPFFLKYYREMGVNHFLFVDNNSQDDTQNILMGEPDVSFWHTNNSYKNSQFGNDWINYLLRRYGHDHWTLTVDPDEFLVYPFCDTRPLRALTDWLAESSVRSLGTMLLDMYPKGRLDIEHYQPGQNPMDIAPWFDSGNYTFKRNPLMGNLWIQGGPRSRMFFADNPKKAPALNKIPLVKWNRRYAYVSSTHMLLPRGLNLVYDANGGEKTSGVLLHAKFLDSFAEKASEELQRKQHYHGSVEYKAYKKKLGKDVGPWNERSEKYINWRQIELLGLMSKGNWA